MRHFLSCAAVAAIGTVLTGAFAAVLDTLRLAIIDPHPSSNWLAALGSSIELYAIVAIALGIVPAVLIVSLSPARADPWRSIPLLSCGSLSGYCLLFVVLQLLPIHFKPGTGWLYVGIVVFPSAGALVASRYLPGAEGEPRTG